MRSVKPLLLAAFVLATTTTALAGVGVVDDVITSFGASATSTTLTLHTTPQTGQVEIIAVQLGATPAPVLTINPNNTNDVWTQVPCTGYGNQSVWTHPVIASDAAAMGTVSWTPSSGGIAHLALRSGMNLTNPVDNCQATQLAGSLMAPSITSAAVYAGEVPELSVETAVLGRCSSPCAQTNWTEVAYANSNVFGEGQVGPLVSAGSTNGLINFTVTGASMTRLMQWFDRPTGTLIPNGACLSSLLLMRIGC